MQYNRSIRNVIVHGGRPRLPSKVGARGRTPTTKYYVNGPGGQIAVYDVNYSPRLFYFLKDQVGSNRAMVNSDGVVVEYRNYHPFGEVMESWISYDEPLEFTGKERDKHRTFDYAYFGARYYDPELGVFSTVDKAGQFSSGFAYCGNNPILAYDPNGSLFFLPILWGLTQAAISASVTSAITYTAFSLSWGDDWTWKRWAGGVDDAMLQGAFGGATGFGLSGLSSAIGRSAPALKGPLGTAIGSSVSNTAMAFAGGAKRSSLWKFGVSGFASGYFGATGGFGLAKKGLVGRLGYQAITTASHSIGNNIASGSDKPLDGFTFGLGPVTFRIGKHEKLLNYADNKLAIWHNAAGAAGVVLGGGKIGWDWGSLSPIYNGGFASLLDKMGYSGYGGYAIFITDDDAILEESHHVWQSRAFGELFYPTYAYNSIAGALSGAAPYRDNWFEIQARNYYWYGGDEYKSYFYIF